jgi:delta-aminolevulinic acid dehydratase/porphobilinogen synthase
VSDVLEALRGYVQLATGLTEVTVAKAREAAAALLAQGIDLTGAVPVPGKDQAASAANAAAGQVAKLADDLVETSEQNRELIVGLVRTEVDRAAGRMGFVREEELAAVRRHVSRLESSLAEVRAQMGAAAAAPAETPASPATESAATADEPAAAEEPAAAPRPRKKKVVVAPEDGEA